MKKLHTLHRSLLQQNKQGGSGSGPPILHKQQGYVVFFVGAIFLIAGGTVTWILSILGVIPGLWSSVFGALFTGTGIIVALLDSLLAWVHADGRRE